MNNLNYERQYFELYAELMESGRWVMNDRTGERCLTIIGHTLRYNSGAGDVPFLSSKRSFPQTAVAEFTGYNRAYTNAQQFKAIGCNTWFQNANETASWLENQYRLGTDDMGIVYGAVDGADESLWKIYNNLRKGVDDRGETYTFWRPDQFHLGCLRPCMRTHTFSILDGTLYLTSESRSVDFALGLNFNSIQCDYFLKYMAQICGLKVGYCTHNLINVHIYEKHLEELIRQMSKPLVPLDCSLNINPRIKTLYDIVGDNKHARTLINIEYDAAAIEKIEFEMTA
jgi:thymidylate synthase